MSDADPEIAQAVQSASLAVDQSPRSAAAWGKLAMVLHANALEQGADFCYQAAASLDPANPDWPYLRGYLHHDGPSGPEVAIPLFRRAAELSRLNSPARIRLADMLVAQNELEQADSEYDKVLSRDERDPDAQLGKAAIAVARREYSEALQLLAALSEHPMVQKRALELLATVYDRLGDTARSDDHRRRLSTLSSDVARKDDPLNGLTELQVGLTGRLRRADILREQQRIQESVEMLKGTAALYPNSDDVWTNLGAALQFTKDMQGAEHAMRKCIEIAPKSAEYRLNLAMFLLAQQRFEEAAKSSRETIGLRPTLGMAHFCLGESLLNLGDRQGAKAAFSDAVRLLPDHPIARQRVNELAGEPDGA